MELLSCAVSDFSNKSGDPGDGRWCRKSYDGSGLLAGGITEETAADFGQRVAREGTFGSNSRAGEEYRRKVAAVLVRRAVLALKEQEG